MQIIAKGQKLKAENSKEHTSYKGILYAIICAILWGVLAIALKVSLDELSPADITWFRFFLAFVVLAIYYLIKKPYYLRIFRRPPLLLIIATLCLATNYYGYIEGLSLTSPGTAQIFIQLGPVLLAASGFVFFHEKAGSRQIAGLSMVVLGLIIFYHEQIQVVITSRQALQSGVLWVLIAAVAWAAYSILLKMLIFRYPPMQLNLVIFGLPVLFYMPFVDFTHFFHIGFTGWLILLFLGLNTLFAYGLLSFAMQYTEANKISVILVLNPILTFALMALFAYMGVTWIKHENYTLASLAGAITVLTGAVLTILKKNHQR
jgi:drug/metabolite transporter (DMT)-like permease